ncbi:MAG TPA: hypothetical protein ENJ29_06720 [Bacteroidetes bacterium]|nr:hypothetical protein [Bacteroidota bacterium]
MKAHHFILVLFLSAGIMQAQIPQTVSYQGVLVTASGAAVADGNYTVTFALYDTPEGGRMLWQETHDRVAVTGGLFSVVLGSRRQLKAAFDRPYFLGISVNNGEEMRPRIELTASAYSLNARSVADSAVAGKSIAAGSVVRSLNGLTEDVRLQAGDNISLAVEGRDVIISAQNQGSQSRNTLDAADGTPAAAVLVDAAGNVGINTTTPATRLHVAGGTDAAAAGGGYITIGGTSGKNMVIDNNEIMARNNGKAATLYLNADSGAIILGKSGATQVGIGTSAPTEQLQLNTASGADTKILFSEGNEPMVSLFYEGSAGAGTNNRLHLRAETSGAQSNVMTWKLNGRVGIGTSNPSAMLDIAGDVRWKPVTRYLTIHPSAFVRRDGTEDPVEILATLGLRAVPRAPLPDVSFAFLYAPVNLPDGAVVTSFQYIYVDQLQNFDTTARLQRKHLTDALVTDMASATSSSYSDHIRTKTDNTIADAVIDNSQYVYSVYVELETHSQPISALYLTAIRIEYTMDRPH